jgi:hypothetical protein
MSTGREINWREKSKDVFEGTPVVTLTSDFGDKWAESQVELAVHRESPDVRVFVLAQISPFSVTEGAFVLLKSYKQTARGSIHIGVVDPGVGTERKGLIFKTRDFWFVGPDNGLLYPAAEDNGIENVYEIDNRRVNTTGLSTFHGRDIFAPVAGRLLSGQYPEELAQAIKLEDIVQRRFGLTEVVHVDAYGNIKLAGSPEALSRRLVIGDQLKVEAASGLTVFPFQPSFGFVGAGEPVAYRGSHETLELAVRLGSGDKHLGGVTVGQVLNITLNIK